MLCTDSDYTRDHHLYRLTNRYMNFMAEEPVSWQLKPYSVVTQSSIEFEYIAMSESAKKGTWI